MTKKILIPVPINKLKPIGGPYGYLYNLNSGLKEICDKSIDISFLPNEEILEIKNSKIKKIIWKIYIILQIILAPCSKKKLNLEDVDIVHFHGTIDMYLHQNSLKKYKGTVLLSSHSPVIWHKEFQELLGKKYKFIWGVIEKIDEYAFQKADYLIFPCEEAEEPYFNSWKKYRTIRENKKVKYILTGINMCYARMDRISVRNSLNIPKDAKVICYVGRHNTIKGYDLLKKAYEEEWKYKGFYVLVAGNEEPIKGIRDDEHWIEIGWTSDPYSYINAADMFVLPNRDTYFDLVLLEALSLNQDVALSETGGNKYFKRFISSNILFFNCNDAEDLAICISKYLDSYPESHTNVEIYKNNFTQKIFAQKYIDMIATIR